MTLFFIKRNAIIIISIINSPYLLAATTPAKKPIPKINSISKNTPIKKTPPAAIKKTPPKKTPVKQQPKQPMTTIVTTLDGLTKALEKFQAEQNKLRESSRSQACNQYVNIAEKCACVGTSCACPVIPKFLTI
jgi:hypothetical protein